MEEGWAERLGLNPEQWSAVKALASGGGTSGGGNLLVSAAAGSGKTRTLVGAYLYLFATGSAPLERIVAITFTEKAGGELRARIREGILNLKPEILHPESVMERLAEAPIGTIHSFCGRILRDYAGEAGLPPDFEVLQPVESQYLLEKVARNCLSPLLVASRKENGRADTLTALLARNEYRFSSILKSIVEIILSARTRHLPPEKWTVYGLKAEERSQETKDRKQTAGQEAQENTIHSQKPDELKYTKDILLLTKYVYDSFIKEKKRQGLVDFDDLLEKVHDLLTAHEDIAIEVSGRFPYILVDEFQDTDILQYAIFQALHRKGARFFFVGDPKQSIYRFRGAEVACFYQARKDFQVTPLHLSCNYRSRKGLVEYYNRFFSLTFSEGLQEIPYEYMKPARESTSSGNEGESLPVSVILHLSTFVEELRAFEVKRLVSLLQELRAGGLEWGDIAVLLRNFSRIVHYESALTRAGIPFFTFSGRGFWDSPEIHDFINFLRCLLFPADRLAYASVLKSPFGGVSDEGLMAHFTKTRVESEPLKEDALRIQAVDELLTGFRERMWKIPLPRLLEEILQESWVGAVLLATPGGLRKYANLKKLVDLARSLSRRFSLTLPDFLEYFQVFQERGAVEGPAPVDVQDKSTVKFLTVHAAKGLEFPVVILVDNYYHLPSPPDILVSSRYRSDFYPDEGILVRTPETDEKGEKLKAPLFNQLLKCERMREREEEKRGLYVACTRAMDRLIFFFSAKVKEDKKNRRWMLDFPKNASHCFSTLFALGHGLYESFRDEGDGTRGKPSSLLDATSIQELQSLVESHLRKEGLEVLSWEPEVRGPEASAPAVPVEMSAVEYQRRFAPIPAPEWKGIREAVKVEAEPPTEAEARWGNILHRFLYLWDFQPQTAQRVLEKVSREFALSKAMMLEVKEMTENILKTPLPGWVESAVRVHKEFSLYERGEAGWVHGKADLILIYPDSFILVDYKVTTGEIEPYRPQLASYTRILKESLALPPRGTYILVLPSTTLIRL